MDKRAKILEAYEELKSKLSEGQEPSIHDVISRSKTKANISYAYKVIQPLKDGGKTPSSPNTITPRPVSKRRKAQKGISEHDLLLQTDKGTQLYHALMAELDTLAPERYVKDFDMRKGCHVGDTGMWRDVYQTPEFAVFVMEIGSHSSPTLYWGLPDSVTSMVERGKARRPRWAEEFLAEAEEEEDG